MCARLRGLRAVAALVIGFGLFGAILIGSRPRLNVTAGSVYTMENAITASTPDFLGRKTAPSPAGRPPRSAADPRTAFQKSSHSTLANAIRAGPETEKALEKRRQQKELMNALQANKVGYPWKDLYRGAELHKDVGQVIVNENHSEAALDFFSLLRPDPERCQCSLERWDQYAVCNTSFGKATNALSLGVNGYDPWGQYVQQQHHLVPRMFDCYNTNKPGGFINDFNPVCVGAKGGIISGKNFTTLDDLLIGVAPRSAIVKMDIEMSEFDLLGTLSEANWGRISSLHVEYHMNYGCPSTEQWLSYARLAWDITRRLAVVDAAAGYYGADCLLGGSPMPKLFAVSYAAESDCTTTVPSELPALPDAVQHIMALLPAEKSELKVSGADKVGYRWGFVQRGGEQHFDVSGVIEKDAVALNYSKEALDIFNQVEPEPSRIRCELLRWDQYAMCRNDLAEATTALSLGINGYDPWGQYVQKNSGKSLVPKTFDCYNLNKPGDFENDFSEVCVGNAEGIFGGKNYTALTNLLSGVPPRSVLLKMDIERSEFDILEYMSDEDWTRIRSLHVEYHMNYYCPGEVEWTRISRILRRVRQKLAVVDGAAGYYGTNCTLTGSGMPKLFAVSYAAVPDN